MKRLASAIVILMFSLLSFSSFAGTHSTKARHSQSAEKEVHLYFFWSKDCPHCVAAHPFIDKLKADYPWLKVSSYEISESPRNTKLFEKMAKERGRETSFVPTFFVGNKMIVGYTSAETTGSEIREAVNEYHSKNTQQS